MRQGRLSTVVATSSRSSRRRWRRTRTTITKDVSRRIIKHIIGHIDEDVAFLRWRRTRRVHVIVEGAVGGAGHGATTTRGRRRRMATRKSTYMIVLARRRGKLRHGFIEAVCRTVPSRGFSGRASVASFSTVAHGGPSRGGVGTGELSCIVRVLRRGRGRSGIVEGPARRRAGIVVHYVELNKTMQEKRKKETLLF